MENKVTTILREVEDKAVDERKSSSKIE